MGRPHRIFSSSFIYLSASNTSESNLCIYNTHNILHTTLLLDQSPSRFLVQSQPIIMSSKALLLFSLLLSSLVIVLLPSSTDSKPLPKVKLPGPALILISFDGFRFGYQFKVPTPNIHRLIRHGTSADLGLIPVFPSLTFPNHYSIATGLYPPHHGIVNNVFFDPVTGEKFSIRGNDPKWWLGEPIWETATRNGHNAAVYFWPGGEVKKNSWTCPPAFCPGYNQSVPSEERVDAVLSYFDLPVDQIPLFTALYFSDTDISGHKYGPDHPEINKAVANLDKMIGRLIRGLKKRGIFDEVSIILVGDHGMAPVCDEKYIFIEDMSPWIDIPSTWVQSQYQLLAIRPPASSNVTASEVVQKMNEALRSGKIANGEYMRVYLKEDLPKRFRYSESDRISPVIGVVDEGYTVLTSRSLGLECGGEHGYDNELFSMRSIFVGHGPRFSRGRRIPSFVNVEIYNVMASVMGLKGAPNNGSVGFVNDVLLPRAHENS